MNTVSGALTITSNSVAGGAAAATQGGAVAGGSVVGTQHGMSGEQQAQLAAQRLAFELESLGFDIVESADEATLKGQFSIGTVRFDPITGWIADEAYLRVTDLLTGKMIRSYKADGRFITPRVETLVDKLAGSIRQDLQ